MSKLHKESDTSCVRFVLGRINEKNVQAYMEMKVPKQEKLNI